MFEPRRECSHCIMRVRLHHTHTEHLLNIQTYTFFTVLLIAKSSVPKPQCANITLINLKL